MTCAITPCISSDDAEFTLLQVNDGFPFSIALSWKPDSQNSAPQHTVVFPKGNAIPSVKALTFYRSSTFEVDVLYIDTGDSQIPQKISTYTVSNALMFMLFNSFDCAVHLKYDVLSLASIIVADLL